MQTQETLDCCTNSPCYDPMECVQNSKENWQTDIALNRDHLPYTVFRLHQNILVSTCVGRITRNINPLTPKSDKHLISPYNITPKSHIKVTTKKGNDH